MGTTFGSVIMSAIEPKFTRDEKAKLDSITYMYYRFCG